MIGFALAMSETLRTETDDLITVVLPVFNALSSNPEYPPPRLESVIAQTHLEFEPAHRR